jgi:hypothetical protein
MAKVIAAQKMYQYAFDSHGTMPYRAHFWPGSEIEWGAWVQNGGGVLTALSNNLDVCYQISPPLNWTLTDWDINVNPHQMGYMGDIMNPQSFDLSVFSNKGGKIIHYQGMSDGLITMDWNLYYYQGMIEANGGIEATNDWYRFFYYPGMGHVDMGSNNTVAYRADYYTYLEDWFEKGKAPDNIMVDRTEIATNISLGKRLYFPWPLVPKYIGENFTGTTQDLINWVGVRVPKRLQAPGLETAGY